MALKRVVFHIGAGKTGSSSIQSLLASSSKVLADQGVAFLGRMLEQQVELQLLPRESWQRNGGWSEWLSSGSNATEGFVARLGEQLDALEELGIHTVIISNEGLLHNLLNFKPILLQLAERGLRIEVVAVLRRHYEWAFSAYLQWGIRHKIIPGRVLSFGQWLDRKRPKFAPSLLAWRDCPGVDHLILINYSSVSDVVPEFLSRLGLELAYEPSSSARINQAASLLEALVLSTYNDHQDGSVHPHEASGLLQRLESRKHIFRSESNHNWPGIGEFDIKQLVKLFGEDLDATNNLLAADGQPTFPNEIVQPPSLPGSLTKLDIPEHRRQEELLAALLSIVVDMDHQIRAQQQLLSQLNRKLTKNSD